MRAYLTEFIGTFFLVLTVGFSTAASGAGNLAPLAIGASLMIMVYAGGHISGGHYNPAVSLAVFLRGKLKPVDFVPYLVAQIAGGLAAILVVHSVITPPPAVVATGLSSVGACLTVEFLYTFALALVVLNTATSPKTKGNSFYGLAIGFTVVVAAFSTGNISGGAFNPSVGISMTVLHSMQGTGTLGRIWIPIVAPLLGGAVAAAVYKFQHSDVADE